VHIQPDPFALGGTHCCAHSGSYDYEATHCETFKNPDFVAVLPAYDITLVSSVRTADGWAHSGTLCVAD
jgi:hypothetical protein